MKIKSEKSDYISLDLTRKPKNKPHKNTGDTTQLLTKLSRNNNNIQMSFGPAEGADSARGDRFLDIR